MALDATAVLLTLKKCETETGYVSILGKTQTMSNQSLSRDSEPPSPKTKVAFAQLEPVIRGACVPAVGCLSPSFSSCRTVSLTLVLSALPIFVDVTAVCFLAGP